MTNLRGNVVPVVGLAERLGWEPSVIHARSCILVVNIAGKQAGFLVDEVNDIVGDRRGRDPASPRGRDDRAERDRRPGAHRHADQKDGTRDEKGMMVLLLDLDALSLTKHLISQREPSPGRRSARRWRDGHDGGECGAHRPAISPPSPQIMHEDARDRAQRGEDHARPVAPGAPAARAWPRSVFIRLCRACA